MTTPTTEELERLVADLREGVVEHPKRWSGDTHADLGGSTDYDATDARMDRAADALEAMAAERGALRETLRQCVKVQQRVQEDTYWRTPDNTLWPDLCDTTEAVRQALAALDG